MSLVKRNSWNSGPWKESTDTGMKERGMGIRQRCEFDSYFCEDSRIWKSWAEERDVVSRCHRHLRGQRSQVSTRVPQAPSQAGQEERSPCRERRWSTAGQLGPRCRRGGNWRQSCLAQRACCLLGTRWPQCHFLCAASSATKTHTAKKDFRQSEPSKNACRHLLSAVFRQQQLRVSFRNRTKRIRTTQTATVAFIKAKKFKGCFMFSGRQWEGTRQTNEGNNWLCKKTNGKNSSFQCNNISSLGFGSMLSWETMNRLLV